MKSFTLTVRFGMAVCASLIAYFLVLSLVDLHTNPFFSLFNGVITGFGIYEGIKYRRLELGDEYNYAEGFGAGMSIGFLATILFTVFLAVYSTELNPQFLQQLAKGYSQHYDIGVASFGFITLLMGFATTIVLTLSFMQLFKKSQNTTKGNSTGTN